MRVGHTVGQSGSPRFGERHGCPTKGSPRPLVVFDRLSYLFSPSDARLSSYVQQSLGGPFARSLTLLKRPPSNLRPYFARLRLPLLKRERGWNDPRVAGVDLSVRDTRFSSRRRSEGDRRSIPGKTRKIFISLVFSFLALPRVVRQRAAESPLSIRDTRAIADETRCPAVYGNNEEKLSGERKKRTRTKKEEERKSDREFNSPSHGALCVRSSIEFPDFPYSRCVYVRREVIAEKREELPRMRSGVMKLAASRISSSSRAI